MTKRSFKSLSLTIKPFTIMEAKNFSVVAINAAKMQFVNSIPQGLKAGVFTEVQTLSAPKMNKGRKPNVNPYFDRVLVRTMFTNVQLGTSYLNSVNNSAERSGSSERAETTKANWNTYYNQFFDINRNKPNNYHLQVQYTASMNYKIQKVYYVDGVEATPQQIEEIKDWLVKSSGAMSSTQQEAGVSEENQRFYCLSQLENVVYIKQGNTVTNVGELLSKFNESEAAKVAETAAE
jgi:hypothetical protein